MCLRECVCPLVGALGGSQYTQQGPSSRVRHKGVAVGVAGGERERERERGHKRARRHASSRGHAASAKRASGGGRRAHTNSGTDGQIGEH